MLVGEKLNQAIKCINEYGNIADSYRKRIQDTMSCLRQAIDEHEQDLLNQILTVENEQKNQMEEYKLRWKYEPENVQMHKAMLDMLLLTKNYAILLNSAQEFEDYVTRTNDVLKTTSLPVANYYELIELDQLEAIKKYIFHCGRYVKTNNSLLVRSALKQHSTQEHSSDSTVSDIHVELVGLTSNEYPNDMVRNRLKSSVSTRYSSSSIYPNNNVKSDFAVNRRDFLIPQIVFFLHVCL